MKERQNSYNFMALEMVIPMAVLTVFFHFFVVAVRAWGLVCLSTWGFGWKLTATTGILKTQPMQNLDTPIYGISFFF
jgi:hypothetical protein